MAATSLVIEATPEQVFQVLADGWTYSDWVVGTVHIRDVGLGFPAPGTVLHHKVGPWPVSLHDNTRILICDPPRLLAMQARLRPLGVATVTLTLEPQMADTTKVTMVEEFSAGPLKWLQTKANDVVLHRRNTEALRRLSDIVVGRLRQH